MGYHQTYYGDKVKPPKQMKYISFDQFNRKSLKFMKPCQLQDFIDKRRKRG